MIRRSAIIIGAGHNGLSAAKELAAAGYTVQVFEQAAQVGGMGSNVEIAQGYTAPRLAHLLYTKDWRERAALEKQGLRFAAKDLPTVALSDVAAPVVIREGSVTDLRGTAHPDGVAFLALRKRLIGFAGKLAKLANAPPPRLEDGDFADVATLASVALGVRRMGSGETREFLRVLLSNAYDTILDEMDDGPLAAAMGLDAVLGGHVGPRAPGTVLSLLYRLMGDGTRNQPGGGMGALMSVYQRQAEMAGATIHCTAPVAKIVVEDDQATGVVLADGTRHEADLVLSNLDPMTTVRLTGVQHFDAEMVRRVRNIRTKGCTAKVNLALSKTPVFEGVPADLMGARFLLAPALARMEKAFNGAKYGEMPTDPILEFTLPSIADSTLVQGGGQVLSAIVQYVPYGLKSGWSEATREDLGRFVIDALDRQAPGLEASIVGQDILTPADIEATYGAPGGHWHHGEMITDQMLMLRPAQGIDQYALPVDGLYLCGASAHPGGDITGLPGRNAAKAILSSRTKRRAA